MIIARQANPDNTNPLHYIFLESNRDAATTAALGLVRLATLDDILQKVWVLRKILSDLTQNEAIEFLIDNLNRHKTNKEFCKTSIRDRVLIKL